MYVFDRPLHHRVIHKGADFGLLALSEASKQVLLGDASAHLWTFWKERTKMDTFLAEIESKTYWSQIEEGSDRIILSSLFFIIIIIIMLMWTVWYVWPPTKWHNYIAYMHTYKRMYVCMYISIIVKKGMKVAGKYHQIFTILTLIWSL